MVGDLSRQSLKQLLQLNGAIVAELKRRGVCRTSNSPIGDIAEHLFSNAFGWQLESNSKAGFDALDDLGQKYQIKSRRVSAGNQSRQAGDIRRLKDGLFDFVAGVVFSEECDVLLGLIIPHRLVAERASEISHSNSSRIYLRDDWVDTPGVRNVTGELREEWERLNKAA